MTIHLPSRLVARATAMDVLLHRARRAPTKYLCLAVFLLLMPATSYAQSVSFTWHPLPTAQSNPTCITTGPDGALWFTENASNKIGRITMSGGITEYPLTPPSGSSVFCGIAAGPDGALWFTETDGNKIGRITTSGAVTEYALPTAGSSSRYITAGPDGALWFTEGNKIGRITTSGVITEYPLPTPGSSGMYITAGPDGALWFTEFGAAIGRITTSGAVTEYPLPTPAGSSNMYITAGPDGALWFTEANKIGRITTSGVVTEYSIPTLDSNPQKITIGPDGALWFTESFGNKIGRITTAGTIIEYPIPTTSDYYGPAGIATGPDGALWFTEFGAAIGRAAIASAPSITTTSLPSATVGLPYSATLTAQGGTPSFTWSISVGALPGGVTLNPSSGTISGTPNAVGTFSFTAKVTDSSIPPQTATQGYTILISQTTISTTLAASPNPATFGQTVIFTVNVSPSTATGTITFKDGNTALNTGTLTNGAATFATSGLAVGSHVLTASYSGDANYSASTSPTVTEVVNKAASTTSLSASPTSSNVGQTVTLTATVNPASATGTVAFKDGAATIGSGTLVSGTATLTTSTLPTGSRSLTAVYGGDNNYNGSTSSAVTETVGLSATTTTLSASPNPANPGQAVTLTATVTPATATGTVTFRDGSATIGSQALSNGSANLSTSGLAVGSHTLTAVYSGDANNSASTSPPVTELVNKAPSTTILVASPNLATPGQAVTLTATVTPSGVTGTVTFQDGSATLGIAALGGGTASLTTSSLAVGSHSLTATYSGDANNSTSTSPPVTEVINKAASTTTLTASSSSATPGQAVTLTATVSPSTATGTIVFSDGNAPLGSAPLNNGTASITTTSLSAGSHSLTAAYSGDGTFSPSTSPAIPLAVGLGSSATGLSASPNPANSGQAVTLYANVTPSSAIGNVTFKDNGAAIGTATLNNGSATYTTSTLAVGSHALTATYSGDSSYSSSTSAPATEVINPAPNQTTTSLSVFPNPAGSGQRVTLNVIVIPISATGSVTFKDNGIAIGTAPLSSGSATFTISTLAVGSHFLTATYSGDSSNNQSTSPPITEVVNRSNVTVNLSPSQNPATNGQSVTLTVNVSPASATGTITVFDGVPTNSVGTATLSNGSATLTTSTLKVGSHSLQASYGGDANNAPGQSAVVTEIVNLAATTTTLSIAPPSSSPGQTVTLTAAVTPSSATGTVTFKDGATTLGTGNLSNGTAIFSASTLAVGSHTLTASYGGDANYAASTSNSVTESVGLSTTTTSLSVTPTSSTFGQPVTLTSTVSPASATGTVTFQDGSTTLGSVTLSGGTATLTTSSLAAGNHTLTASYGGDSKNGASTSNTFTASVTKLTSSTVLSASPTPSTAGQAVTVTATVKPPSATGTVTFLDGQNPLGTAALNGGAAVFTTSALVVGTHALSASYSGDANDAGSTSATITQTVVSGIPVQITSPTALGPALVSAPYSQTFTATGGAAPLTWSAGPGNGSGTLVPGAVDGLNMSANGVFSGTPAAAGSFQMWVRVQDSASGANSTVLTLAVLPLPSFSFSVTQPTTTTDQPAPKLTLAQSYPFALTGTVTLTFVPNATGLPAGFNDAQFASGGPTFQVTHPCKLHYAISADTRNPTRQRGWRHHRNPRDVNDGRDHSGRTLPRIAAQRQDHGASSRADHRTGLRENHKRYVLGLSGGPGRQFHAARPHQRGVCLHRSFRNPVEWVHAQLRGSVRQ